VSVQVMDTWSLAFLSPVAPDLFESLYRRWRRLARRKDDVAWVAARWPNADLEVGDVAQNTAFGYVAACEAGDRQLAERLRRFAVRSLGLARRGNDLRCWDVDRWLMISALFALGDALTPGAMRKAVSARPAGFFDRPALESITGDVALADWDVSGALIIEGTGDGEITLAVRNSTGEPEVSRGELLSVRRSNTGSSVVLRGSSFRVRLPAA
jgi:hypothetical protein